MCSRESGNPEPQAPSSATLDSRFRGSTGDGTSEQSVASSTLRRAMYAPLIDLDAPPPPVSSPLVATLVERTLADLAEERRLAAALPGIGATKDRKSTRLNSSH